MLLWGAMQTAGAGADVKCRTYALLWSMQQVVSTA